MTKREFNKLQINDLIVVSSNSHAKGVVLRLTSKTVDGFEAQIISDPNDQEVLSRPWLVNKYENYSKYYPSNIFLFLYT